MVPIGYTTHSACQLSLGMSLLAAALGGCFLALFAIGLPLYLLVGSASFDPALNFAREILPQLPVSLVWLSIVVYFLLALAGFGYRCIAVKQETGNNGTLLTLVRRFKALVSPPPTLQAALNYLDPARMGILVLFSSSSRMFAPSASSLSGASPQLE